MRYNRIRLWARAFKNRITLILTVAVISTSALSSMTVCAVTTVDVTGTIDSASSKEVMKLQTSEGLMHIKVDGDADLSRCTAILNDKTVIQAGKTVTVSVYRGEDAYMHASRIVPSAVTPGNDNSSNNTAGANNDTGSKNEDITVDRANTATVTGIVAEKSTSELIHLNMDGGVMLMKVDASTDISNCQAVQVGSKITAVVAHGSDGYMHAISMSGSGVSVSVDKDDLREYGIIMDGTNSEWLILNVDGTSREIRREVLTEYTSNRILLPGKAVTVDYYLTTDGIAHAKKVMDGKAEQTSASSAAASQSSTESNTSVAANPAAKNTVDVTGKITSDSTTSILHIDTEQGKMLIKMTGDTNQSQAKMLIPGNTVTVSTYNGGDGYMYATFIKAGYKLDADVAADTTTAVTIDGKITAGSDANLLRVDLNGSGIMLVRVDTTTDYTGCRLVKTGQKVTMSVARGDDGYMHALSISQ